jgi:group I intron endonuclease
MTIGIYILFFNNDRSKVYVGLSKNIEKRFIQHKYALKYNYASKKLQEAYNKFGIPSMEILLECEANELEDSESSAIELFDSINRGYNSVSGGSIGAGAYGDLNGKSIYSNSDIIEAFNLLIGDKYLTYRDIENICGVSKAVITNIKTGRSHKWLEQLYPIEYTKLISSCSRHSISNILNRDKHSAFSRGISYPTIFSPEGVGYSIKCLTDFAKEHNLSSSALCRVLKGKISHHKGWRILNEPC